MRNALGNYRMYLLDLGEGCWEKPTRRFEILVFRRVLVDEVTEVVSEENLGKVKSCLT